MHYTLWPLGDQALLVRIRERVGIEPNALTHAALRALEAAALPGVRAIAPSYAALCVELDLAESNIAVIESAIHAVLAQLPDEANPAAGGTCFELPTRYGGADGPDLVAVAELCGLSVAQTIELHAGVEYRVAMIGFLPGFPYLLGLPAALEVPRLATPRPRVPAGSVAIAGAQAGVYPSESPGGWRLLGRTEMALFEPMQTPPNRLQAGDRVRFVPI
jgi:KipI family sensor histidine kinase inhibitor